MENEREIRVGELFGNFRSVIECLDNDYNSKKGNYFMEKRNSIK